MRGSVAIVGLGGLGSPAAATLAESGVPRLALIDPDAVELSNLPRQPLYGLRDIGEPKAESAARRLRAAFPSLVVDVHVERLDRRNGEALLAPHDVILDGTDSLEAKVLLNELALRLDKPLIHAGVVGLEGQLFTIVPRRSACLRCLFVELPDGDDLPTCEQAGVLGPVVGAIGVAAAREAISLLEGRPAGLCDRLAILDGRQIRWREVELRQNPRCPLCAQPPAA